MFTAKVYRVAIPSSGIILKEDKIAYETIARWSIQSGEKNGIVLLPIPAACSYTVPDIYIFNIDNYVDEAKVDAAFATGARVTVFFRQTHDMDNSISGELKAVVEFQKKVQGKCSCFTYTDSADYESILIKQIECIVRDKSIIPHLTCPSLKTSS